MDTVREDDVQCRMRWVHRSLFAAGLAVLVSCSAGVDGGPEFEDEVTVDSTQEEITNGYSMSQNETGHVALKTWPDHWTFCSSVLMTNTKALTAKHCLTGWPPGQLIYAQMGTQSVWVTAQVLKTDFDVAMIKFLTPFRMAGSYSGYARPIYSGTNASLNNVTTFDSGYGPGGYPGPTLRWGYFNTTFNDGYNPSNELHVWKNGVGQLPEGGDSGSGFTSGLGPNSPVTMISGGCFSSPLNMCYGAGAESWRSWAQFLIAFW